MLEPENLFCPLAMEWWQVYRKQFLRLCALSSTLLVSLCEAQEIFCEIITLLKSAKLSMLVTTDKSGPKKPLCQAHGPNLTEE
jgi:hypothetical protein